MLLKQFLEPSTRSDLWVIHQQCSKFVSESGGLAVVKLLPTEYKDVHKVKARKRNLNTPFTETFNQAFKEIGGDLCQRAIFAQGEETFVSENTQDQEKFYVFPINGYKYLYSEEVCNSSSDYKKVLDVMFEHFGGEKGKDVVTDLIKFSYKTSDLREGINQGAEIIFYNIPFYYAVRSSLYEDYADLLSDIQIAQ